MLVTGCTAPAALASSIPATPAVRPDMPDDWVTFTSDDGSVSISAPPDFESIQVPGGLVLQTPFDGTRTPIQITAIGPAGIQPQPRGGEPLGRWLESGTWAPDSAPGGILTVVGRSEGDVLLPAGRAYLASATVEPGTDSASRVAAYAIATEDGFAVLQILGYPEAITSRADELRMIPLLLEFPPPG